MQLGSLQKQPRGFSAFIPYPFPPKTGFNLSAKILQKAAQATLALGKLDGITQLLPDVDFFLFMYIRKDATSSSQIEGTKATMLEAIEAEAKSSDALPADVNDIQHYIHALNYGLERLKELPLTSRLICELHRELMKDARCTHFADPGNFRQSQNYIGGTSPGNAHFVPPPAHEVGRATADLENFIHANDDLLPIIKAGIIHAQFETIHPFLDGNGRTGRMLITLYLCLANLLERPTLFLSWYFKKHQKVYYELLDNYRDAGLEKWLEFFLDGVIEVASEAIETVKKITVLREEDMYKIQTLDKKASSSAVKILPQLFKLPIVNVAIIQKWTGFTDRGAQKVIDRFIDLGILKLKDENKKYGRSFIYHRYTDIFSN
ncbi:MAG: Fic family protein [Candidatus Gracilibacteria bacterium]|jgi:Fic family protein